MTPLQNAQVGQEVLQTMPAIGQPMLGIIKEINGSRWMPIGVKFPKRRTLRFYSTNTDLITNDPSTIAKFKEGR